MIRYTYLTKTLKNCLVCGLSPENELHSYDLVMFFCFFFRFLPVKAQLASHRALGLGEMMNTFEVIKPKYNWQSKTLIAFN